MNGLDAGALDRWIEGGQAHKEEGEFRCVVCDHVWTQIVRIEYGGIVDDLECPQCDSVEVEVV